MQSGSPGSCTKGAGGQQFQDSAHTYIANMIRAELGKAGASYTLPPHDCAWQAMQVTGGVSGPKDGSIYVPRIMRMSEKYHNIYTHTYIVKTVRDK